MIAIPITISLFSICIVLIGISFILERIANSLKKIAVLLGKKGETND